MERLKEDGMNFNIQTVTFCINFKNECKIFKRLKGYKAEEKTWWKKIFKKLGNWWNRRAIWNKEKKKLFIHLNLVNF